MKIFLVIAASMYIQFVPVSAGANSHVASNRVGCELPTTQTKTSSSGEVKVIGADNRPHSIFWTKLGALSTPSKGTLFYLAGGPLSHLMYVDMAAAFQKNAFPQFDVILYDYYGFNCSHAIQDVAALEKQHVNLTMPAMAADFIQLKRKLLGKGSKAFLMGGSHGAMLGAQIIRDYPSEINKAVLFSGDTESGWLANGWLRFDRVLQKLGELKPGFAQDLSELLTKAESGQLEITVDKSVKKMTRADLELGLWIAFALNSVAQAALPQLVHSALRENQLDWLSNIYSAQLALLAPIERTPIPTDVSVVTNFHRCNVWFPKSTRESHSNTRGIFLNLRFFVNYWDQLCRNYDGLGEFPFAAKPKQPTATPILSWVGDQDTFDPEASRRRLMALSSNVEFHTMEGWAHDFGSDEKAGFLKVVTLIRSFFHGM